MEKKYITMVDITSKKTTLRTAFARATVMVSKPETIEAMKKNTIPKGNVFEMSKAAGLLGIKNTPLILPDCHLIPIESVKIIFEITGLAMQIFVKVKTIYKTGVEVEAMHGASVIALNVYDMLKPIDKGIYIQDIRLINKKGGKSDFIDEFSTPLNAAVVVCSDSISAGIKEDNAGKSIIEKLSHCNVTVSDYIIIPDEQSDIQKNLNNYASKNFDIVVLTGGTGFSSRDITPESLVNLLDRRMPGVEEAIRSYGQQRTPYSMLSRSVVGIIKKTVVIALPGSTKGTEESMDAIFPEILHVFHIMKGGKHKK